MEVRESLGGGHEDRELEAMAAALMILQPLEPDERSRVLGWLAAKLGVAGRAVGIAPSSMARPGQSEAPIGSIKDFSRSKQPGDDVARALVLGYFVTHTDDQTAFAVSDLGKARIEAAMPTFNTSRAVSHGRRSGYLTSAAEKGSYQLTAIGEELVEAMPDAERIRAAKAKATAHRRRVERRDGRRGTTDTD